MIVLVASCGPATVPAPVVPDRHVDTDTVTPPPPVEAGALTWTDGVATLPALVTAITLAGDDVVWAVQEDSAIRGAPLAGGAATVLARIEFAKALAPAGDRIYVAARDALWSVPANGGEATRLLELGDGRALAVGTSAVYVVDGEKIVAVPRDGGAGKTLVARAGEPVAIVTDDTHVYWADHGGTIGRVAATGGDVERIARAPHHPTRLARVGDDVYRSSEGGAAITRAPRAGGDARSVLDGHSLWIGADAAGVAVLTAHGLLLEVPAAGGPAAVRAVDLGRNTQPVLAGDSILVAEYVGAEESGDQTAIHLYPRGAAALTVIASSGASLVDLALRDDDVYYLEAYQDDRPDRIMRVARAGGDAAVIATLEVEPTLLAVTAHHIVYADKAGAVRTTDRAEPLAEGVMPGAIAADDQHAYWMGIGTVMSVPLAGGKATAVYAPPGSGGPSESPVPATLIVSKKALVAASAYIGGAWRFELGPQPKKAKKKKPVVAVAGAVDVAVSGDRLVTWIPGRGLMLDDRVLLAEPDDSMGVGALAADASTAWLAVRESRGSVLYRVPLDGSEPERIAGGFAGVRLVVADDAVYFTSDFDEAVFRLSR
jgi:hypothetical protein